MADQIVGTAPDAGSGIVTDKGSSSWSDLWRKEDYWAIWLGLLLLAIGMVIFFPRPPEGMHEKINAANQVMEAEEQRAPIKTIEWYQAQDVKSGIRASSQPFAKSIAKFVDRPQSWKTNPIEAVYLSKEDAGAKSTAAMPKYEQAKAFADQQLAEAKAAQEAAAAMNFQDTALNDQAKTEIAEWRAAKTKASDAKRKTEVKPYNILPYMLVLLVGTGLFFSIGTRFMGNSVGKFLIGFPAVFALAFVAYLIANQTTMRAYGFEYALWAVLIGMIISNTIGTPAWVKPAIQVEYYIKTGLVLLGAEVLFNKILAIGVPGIFVAWVVTPVVLITTYIFGQRVLKMPSKTLNITISSDMSVCGVSAAIATAAACRAKKEELTLAVGMSMAFTAVMMIAMPAFIKAVGMDHILGGAWIGGTVDSTGAVAAAGAFLSERALYVAATIKMIQNVLIGIIAFGVATYWCYRVDCVPGQKVSPWEIWHRFPKFVLGFIGASILFSFIYGQMGDDAGYAMVDHGVLRGFTRPAREWFFALAFASIGLATNFRELKDYFKGGKPLILYVCGQSFNLALTLLMAYIMFYKVFPHITAGI